MFIKEKLHKKHSEFVIIKIIIKNIYMLTHWRLVKKCCFIISSSFVFRKVKVKVQWLIYCKNKNINPYGVVEIHNSKNGVTFKVNGQRIKPYLEYQLGEASVVQILLNSQVHKSIVK